MGTRKSTLASPGGVSGYADRADRQREIIQTPASPALVTSTRASRTWVKLSPALLVLALILVFVFQNSRTAKVSFATASGRIPLALALLAAAALGALFVFTLGSIRILQLRRTIHRLSRRHQAGDPQAREL
jgi:uncharacterized integral membrane protein